MNAAVILIDMQEYFLESAVDKERVIDAQKNLLEYCLQKEVPTVLTVFANPAEGPDYGMTHNDIFNIWHRISESRRRFIVKIKKDAFSNPCLECALNSWSVDSLLFAGLYGGQCIKATARTGIELGYDVATAEDLITDEPAGRRITGNLWPSTRSFFSKEGTLYRNSSEAINWLEAYR